MEIIGANPYVLVGGQERFMARSWNENAMTDHRSKRSSNEEFVLRRLPPRKSGLSCF